MDPVQILRNFIGKGGNVQQVVANMASKGMLNPIIGNLIKEANKGNTAYVENFAENFFKEQGRNFNQEYTNFMHFFR